MSQTEVQLIKDAVIVNADISNSAAIDISKISGAMPLTGGSFSGDVSFGDNNITNVGVIALDIIKGDADDNTNMTFGGSDTITFKCGTTNPALTLNTTQVKVEDGQQFVAGTGNDLQILHSGGVNQILSGGPNLKIGTSGETFALFENNASVQLYYDNEKMFTTNGDGAEFFDSDSNLNIYFTTNNTTRRGYIFVESTSGGKISFYDPQNHPMLSCTKNGSVDLYHDNSLKLATTSTGVSVTGKATFPDGNSNGIVIGDSGDYRLFHNGANSYIENDTGNLVIDNSQAGDVYINSGDDIFIRPQGGEDGIRVIGNGEVIFFHDGNQRAVVQNDINMALDNSSGTAGKGKIGFGNSGMPFIQAFDTGNHGSGSKLEIYDGDGDLFISCLRNSAITFFADGAQKFFSNSNGLQIKNDLNILFKKESSTSGSVICIDFDKDNPTNNVGDISMTNSAVSYNTGSDYRLKENERPIDDAITKVKELKPYYFNFKETPETLSQGFYAHEVSDIVPPAVTGEKDEIGIDGKPKYQTLDYSKMVPMLAAGLKALIEKVEKLEAE